MVKYNPEQKFTWTGEELELNDCLSCKYFIGKNKCNAFPLGIPEEIIMMEVSHRKPYPGDNGIQFERAE